MAFSGSDVPQANKIWDVAALVQAVGHGADGDIALGAAIGKNDRQGRYYRLAAESIGLLEPVEAGHSELADDGAYLVAAPTKAAQRDILIASVLSSAFFRSFLAYIHSAGAGGRSDGDLIAWIDRNTDLSGATPARRYSTVRAWLEDLDLVDRTRWGLTAVPYDSADIEFRGDPREALPVGRRALVPFQGTAPSPKPSVDDSVIQYWVDRAKLERASTKHEELVATAARLSRDAGFDVSKNAFVDLFASGSAGSYLFEMKSNNEHNTVSQVRRAISQLYEYQYQQSLETSRLVLALESQPEDHLSWIVDYLVHARNILPVWAQGGAFGGPEMSQSRLPWLML